MEREPTAGAPATAANTSETSPRGSCLAAAFDRAYATPMVEGHEKTVALFEREAEAGGNAGIEAFAQKALPTLRAHLEHAQQLANEDS